MTALKTASHNLLTQLKNAAQVDGDVYVSIIPFGKDVNVGPENYACLLDRLDRLGRRQRHLQQSQLPLERTVARATAQPGHPPTHSTWNGCVTDRDQNYDTLNTAPISGGTLFPAEQYASCNTPIMALSYDWTALNNKIDMMTPAGNTNQAIGLAWGWQSLSQTAPLNAPALDPNYQYQQVIILLTDGLNTREPLVQQRQTRSIRASRSTCNNIKAAGITIYTVLVMSGNSTLLKNCATDREQVLRADQREPDRHDVRRDRHEPFATAPLALTRVKFARDRNGSRTKFVLNEPLQVVREFELSAWRKIKHDFGPACAGLMRITPDFSHRALLGFHT